MVLILLVFIFDVFDGCIVCWCKFSFILGCELDLLFDVIFFGVVLVVLVYVCGM